MAGEGAPNIVDRLTGATRSSFETMRASGARIATGRRCAGADALTPRPIVIIMARYLISFPSAAMAVPDGELESVGRDARAVIDAAKAAGVCVFAGGIDEDVPPALVSADGAVVEGGYAWAPPLDGGFTVLELSSREEAVAWAARLARACRCSQELRVFGFDPQA